MNALKKEEQILNAPFVRICRMVYLGLGSNLGDRHNNIERAVCLLKEEPEVKVLRVSSIIETEPEENINQPKFLNAVSEIETNLSPIDLLGKLKRIENRLGRPKEYERNSPRIIDLDILIFGDLLLRGKTLTIPHVKLHKRHFVLGGIVEFAPDLFVPGHKKTVKQLLDDISGKILEKTYESN